MTRPLRIVIADDEVPARQVLREYLGATPGIALVAECANGFDAVKAIAEHDPDLLLLDVQMPRLDGFEVLELIGNETAVVFTTAYDEYALRAFDVHAVDYLLKPFSLERLQQALERARTRLARGVPVAPSQAVAAAARPPGTWLTRVVIREGTDVHIVPIDRIDYVEAQDDYIAVWSGDRSRLKEQPLSALEQQLDPRRFVRIHRSYLLNLDRLARIEATGKDSRVAVLRDGRRLPVSRSGYARLQELL